MEMLVALHVGVREGNSRIQPREFGYGCTSKVSPDLMLCRWAFLDEQDSLKPGGSLTTRQSAETLVNVG